MMNDEDPSQTTSPNPPIPQLDHGWLPEFQKSQTMSRARSRARVGDRPDSERGPFCEISQSPTVQRGLYRVLLLVRFPRWRTPSKHEHQNAAPVVRRTYTSCHAPAILKPVSRAEGIPSCYDAKLFVSFPLLCFSYGVDSRTIRTS
jgi:hypothetical protein